MITGVINLDLEAIVRLTVRGANGRRRRIKAVIDTGFDGSLSLPPTLIAELGLVWDHQSYATLADGSEVLVDMYLGFVVWNRRRLLIDIDESDTDPLIGTGLLADFEMRAQFRPRGHVTIKTLRQPS
ncbi:MAG: clan AA aspartic protease [Planctomycetes bacterium]|nr:clan AA aspartic protease [Planctomycetota bacterium]